jgi:hypothetical protein
MVAAVGRNALRRRGEVAAQVQQIAANV